MNSPDNPTTTLHLDTTSANVREIWERHGFAPTTEEEQALRQLRHPHVEQCRCKFCQLVKEEG